MGKRHRIQDLSITSRAWFITVIPAITGVLVSLILGSICLNVIDAIRQQTHLSEQMHMVIATLNEGTEFVEEVIRYNLGSNIPNPVEREYDPGHWMQTLAHSASKQPELREKVSALAISRKKFHDSLKLLSKEDLGQCCTTAVLEFRRFSVLTLSAYDYLQKQSVKTETESTERVTRAFYLVIALFSINYVFSIVLLGLFCRHVARRLEILKEMTTCLASNRMVTERLKGNDEIKKLEANLVALSLELSAAQKRKQDFIAMISHDLRSPLTSIGMTLELFAGGIYGEPDETFGSNLQLHHSNVQRLITFISDLLDLEKAQAGLMPVNKTAVDLGALLKRIKEELTDFSRSQNKIIELFCDEKLPPANVDPDKITMAISRLVQSCLSETPGPVRLKLTRVSSGDRILLIIESSVKSLQLIDRNDIFNRFSRASPQATLFNKQRLSLALARELVLISGGEVEVITQPGMIRFQLLLRTHRTQGES